MTFSRLSFITIDSQLEKTTTMAEWENWLNRNLFIFEYFESYIKINVLYGTSSRFTIT